MGPFSKLELLLKERICSHRERILSFKRSSLWYGKSLLPHWMTSLECYYFYYARAYLCNGSYNKGEFHFSSEQSQKWEYRVVSLEDIIITISSCLSQIETIILFIVEGSIIYSSWGEMYLSRDKRFPTMWYVRPAKAQTSLRIQADLSEPLLVA